VDQPCDYAADGCQRAPQVAGTLRLIQIARSREKSPFPAAPPLWIFFEAVTAAAAAVQPSTVFQLSSQGRNESVTIKPIPTAAVSD